MKIDPKRLHGAWTDGYALDDHTASSVMIGYDEYGHERFDTVRTEVGEALYKLKYKGARSQVTVLANAAAVFMSDRKVAVDVVVAVPPTRERVFQPSLAIAEAVAAQLHVPFDATAIRRTIRTQELKGVLDPSERARLLDGAFEVSEGAVEGKNVLLLDDLFRSGTTMNAAAKLLFDPGHAAQVVALALTRTRSIR